MHVQVHKQYRDTLIHMQSTYSTVVHRAISIPSKRTPASYPRTNPFRSRPPSRYPRGVWVLYLVQSHATTLIPIDLACEITLLHSPSKANPDNRSSDCLMHAISYTCFNDTCPTVSCPGAMAARSRFLRGSTSAACINNHEVAGVRRSKANDRSGRTVTRAGTGVPG